MRTKSSNPSEAAAVIKTWRERWSEMSRVTRYGFWLTVVAGLVGLALIGMWVISDYSGPWERVSDMATAIMFVGLAVQGGGHVRDRRARRHAHH